LQREISLCETLHGDICSAMLDRPRRLWLEALMSAPLAPPVNRSPADMPRLEHLMPGGHVWVFRGGEWRPGIVVNSSVDAAVVRYRPTDGSGTAVDTVMARNLAYREDPDAYLDSPQLRPSGLPARAAATEPIG
jgi:hypothetical protein